MHYYLLNMFRIHSMIMLFMLSFVSHKSYCAVDNDSLIAVIDSKMPDSLRVDAGIRLGESLRTDFPDSAMLILKQASKIACDQGHHFQCAQILFWQGTIYIDNNDYPNALEHSLKSKELILNDPQADLDSTMQALYFRIMHQIGTIYLHSGNFEQAHEYYDLLINSLNQYEFLAESNNGRDLYLRVYINKGAVYLTERKFDQATIYYTRALSYLKEDQKLAHAVVLNNLGIIAYEGDDIQTGLDYHRRSLAIRLEENNYLGMAQSYNNLGNCYRKLGEYDKALEYYNKGLKTSEENGLLRSNVIALNLLALIYEELKDWGNAYQFYKEFKELSDSIIGQDKIQTIAKLEQQYKFNEKLHLAQLKQEKLEFEKSRQKSIFHLFIGIAVLSIAILILVYFLQRSKIKREQLVAEKNKLRRKSLELEKSGLEDELAYRNRELATKAMYLARTNEFIVNMSERLLKSKLSLSKENQSALDSIIRELRTHSNKEVWEEFEVRFEQVHSDFYVRLNEHCPSLSPNEKKLCAFLRLNMTSKEISAITYQTVNSITVARARLRKKLDLDSEENLIAFLEKL
jgi:tetratricopeptide (TPR) repeat protein